MCMAWQTPCRHPILREAITCNRCTQVFVLETMVSKTPVCARKPWQCRDLKLRSCMIVLGRRNLTAKFDGGISGEVFRRKTTAKYPAKNAAKFRRNFVRSEMPSRKLHRNSTANSTATQNRVAKTCRQGMFS